MTAKEMTRKENKKARVALNAKVSPEMAEKVHQLKRETGAEVTVIVEKALEAFFDGWEPSEAEEAEEDTDLE